MIQTQNKINVNGSISRENIGRHTRAVVLKFFVEGTDFTKSLMSTKKQLNIIENKRQRTLNFSMEPRLVTD